MRILYFVGLWLATAVCFAEDSPILSNLGDVSENLLVSPHFYENHKMGYVPEQVFASDSKGGSRGSFVRCAFAQISAFVVASSFLGAGIYENKKASDIASEYNGLEVHVQGDYDKAKNSIDRRETLRNVYYGVASVVFSLGVLTFFF